MAVNNLHKNYRNIYRALFALVSILVTFYLGVSLQAGQNPLNLFILNDLVTEPKRLSFALSFPIAFITSLWVSVTLLKLPRYDFHNRILVVNLIVFGLFIAVLAIARIHIYSRTVVVSEFVVTAMLLVIFFSIEKRLFPKVLGVLPGIDASEFENYPWVKLKQLRLEKPELGQLDGIIANLGEGHGQKHTRYLTYIAQTRIPIYDINVLSEILWGRIQLTDLHIDDLDRFRPSIIHLAIKRLFDIVFVLSISPVALLLGLIISLAIKLDTPGPVLFSQERTGRHGKPFTMFKFRSMYDNKYDEQSSFAVKNDKRITSSGKVLRRLRLDELPQLWNVLKGEMSTIGPRPEQLQFTTHFDELIPYYGFRHIVRPGITGWSQVMFGYAATDEQTRTKLAFDFFYIKHISMWLDFVILFKPIRTIAIGSGAR